MGKRAERWSRGLVVAATLMATGCDRIASVEGDSPGECSDGADNDRDGRFDCADPGCAPSPDCPEAEDYDVDDDGYLRGEDCDDTDAQIHPGAPEIPYDNVNNDCDTETPDDDLDGDGVGRILDCDDRDPRAAPTLEEAPYDGVDNDCDPETPDDDLDGDGLLVEDDCDDRDDSLGEASAPSCLNAARADITVAGHASGMGLGASVVFTGDLDDDGTPDLVLGAPGADADKGAVFFLSGAALLDAPGGAADTTTADASWHGRDQFDGLGAAGRVDWVPAPDGVGAAALLIAHPLADPGGLGNAGEVYLIAPDTPEAWHPDLAVDEAATLTIQGRAAGDKLGSPGVAIDLDGDGLTELVLCAPQDDTAFDNAGQIAVFDGAGLGEGVVSSADADTFLWGDFNERLGAGAITGLGDVNGDGSPELAVGSPGSSSAVDADVGVVFLVSPLTTGPIRDVAIATLSGVDRGGRFGAAISHLHDLDEDGHADLLIGASQGALGPTDSGTLSLWLGGADLAGALPEDAAELRWSGPVGLSGLGGVTHSADLSGDGVVDILAGSPFERTGGRVYGLMGAELDRWSGGPVDAADAALWISGGGRGGFGSAVGAADLDGEGAKDIAVGAPAAGVDSAEQGVVSLFLR